MTTFLEYVDKKELEAKKQLSVLIKLLKSSGLQVESFLDEKDPYVFLKSTNNKLDFDGIRIYKIGDTIAYRIQKESKTHPFGKSYMLQLEQMFNDYMSDGMKEEEAGKKVIKEVINELKSFFDKSLEAETEIGNQDQEKDGIMLRTGGTDYSSLVFNKN